MHSILKEKDNPNGISRGDIKTAQETSYRYLPGPCKKSLGWGKRTTTLIGCV
jgi:hypothetical protein